MGNFILYQKKDGVWSEYAQFKDRRDYATRVAKVTDGRTDAPAKVLRTFVLGGVYIEGIGNIDLVKRALRHFDEVGLSNDIFESLEEMSCAQAVAFTKTGLETLVKADFSGLEI
ncbi:MAG: hypothetical protein IJX96_03430 [Clostridia bacterium]|nr:hypothetical protein [Clostridia bacterium]